MAGTLIDTLDADGRRTVENVRAAAERVWSRPLHRYYTDHTVAHSERVIALLDGLAAGMMDTPRRLAPGEILILLAAAYLHDVGMQDERFAGGDLDEIREAHHEVTAELIYRAVENPAQAVALGLPGEPGLVEAVALVAKGHRRVDLGSAEYEPLVHGGETVRLQLLAAFLRFGDELDIDHRRVDLEQMKLLALPVESQLHWWKCHYVSGVSIVDEYIRVAYRFPHDRPDYEGFIVPLVEGEIRAKHAALEEIFRANAVKVALGKPRVRLMRLVQPLPSEVEALAKTGGEAGGKVLLPPTPAVSSARAPTNSSAAPASPLQSTAIGKKKHTVQDYVKALDDFVTGLNPLKYKVERQETGAVTTYVFYYKGTEIGRVSVKPSPEWSAALAQFQVYRTAASRGANIAFERQGSVLFEDWPEVEQERNREFVSLWQQAEAHFDLWFGTGIWSVVHAANNASSPPSAPETIFDQRGQIVDEQINVAGDYVDRRSPGSRRDAPGSTPADAASLRRQLAEARENLRLIEERKAAFVMSTDVPLQLIKEEQRLRARIAELEARESRAAA